MPKSKSVSANKDNTKPTREKEKTLSDHENDNENSMLPKGKEKSKTAMKAEKKRTENIEKTVSDQSNSVSPSEDKETRRAKRAEKQRAQNIEKVVSQHSKAMSAHSNYTDDNVKNENTSIGYTENHVNINYGTSHLLTDATINFVAGRIYGIVAKNGLGKSALLHRLNRMKIDATKLLISQEQELENQDLKPYDALVEYHTELREAVKRSKQIEELGDEIDDELNDEYIKLQDTLIDLEADKQDSNIRKILHGLGFTKEHMNKPIKELSGGWRKRVVLAAAVYRQPEFLMLDEPTNHLDLETVVWLSNYLLKVYTTRRNKRPRTLIVVSHNADFMQTLCKTIVTIDRQKLHYYDMDYRSYLTEHMSRMTVKQVNADYDSMLALHNLINAKTDRPKDYTRLSIDLNHYKMTVDLMKQQEFSRAWYEEFKRMYNGSVQKQVEFPLLEPIYSRAQRTVGGRIVTVRTLMFGYPGKENLFDMVDLDVNVGDVMCFCGANGSGKSTLLRLIADSVKPDGPGVLKQNTGFIEIAEYTKIGYYSQHVAEQLPPDMTAFEYIKSIRTMGDNFDTVTKIYELLTHFGISDQVVKVPTSQLSGGQKSRVLLAGLCVQRPNLLILDEPTNHLDVESIQALVETINKNTALTFLIITHDSQLINQLDRAEIKVLSDKKLTDYEYSIIEYKEDLLRDAEL